MRRIIPFFSLLLIAGLLTACNLPKPNQAATQSGDWIATAAAQTVEALSTEFSPPATPEPQLSTPIVITPSATIQLATATPNPTTPPCDRADFVNDVTIPDGTKLKPGESFVKTWRLKNSGSCTWTSSYRVVFDSGNALGAPASFNLPADVAPGATTDISVQMKAPDTAKDYESNWKLQNASGAVFGTGSTGAKAFWVHITVIAPTQVMFAITNVVITADNNNFTGACPHTFNLTAEITSTTAGKVTYFWERSDGSKTTAESVQFDSGGKKAVNSTWQVSASLDGWIKIYIDNPNHQYFAPYTIKASCSP